MKHKFMYLWFFFIYFIIFSSTILSQTDEFGPQGSNRYLFGCNGVQGNDVAIPNSGDFFLVNSGTIEAWIYPFQIFMTGNQKVIINNGQGNQSWEIDLVGCWLQLQIYHELVAYSADADSIKPNTWTHIAVTFWGGPYYYSAQWYINGVASGPVQNKTVTMHSNIDPLIIGSDGGYSSYHDPWYGNIDEVRIWNRARTQTEIASDRFVGLGDGGGANTNQNLTSGAEYNGLVSSYTFNYNSSNVFDDISNHTGTYIGSTSSTGAVPGNPIPYNLALFCPGTTNDFIQIPDNSIWNNSFGTFEAWINILSSANDQTIIQKGNGSPDAFNFFLNTNRHLCLNIGSQSYISTGAQIPIGQWCHVAVTYRLSTGPNVVFYLNGNINSTLSIAATTMPSNSFLPRIGNRNSTLYNSPFNGYIDELRFWQNYRNVDSIKKYMYVSSKSISNPWLKSAYPFDGNLLNYGNTSGLGGTFDNGLTTKSKCRFSGYRGEGTGGPIGINLEAHPTNLNYYSNPNPFPNNFYLSAPNLTIPDNTTVYDSIMVSDFPGNLTAIDVFVGIEHTYISDLGITIIAPNGNQALLLYDRGGAGKHLLTFFNDNYILTSTTAGYNPPWSSFLKPDNAMGTFGNTPVNGKWKIKISDNQTSDVGTLIEWGLRFNASIGIRKIDEKIPNKFNLYQNYPNPFNPTTNIKFDLPKNLFVSLKIYDILGKEVANLISSELTAGSYNAEWNASQYSNGIYFYRIETGNYKETKKMLLIK